jgi:hypothetical protein
MKGLILNYFQRCKILEKAGYSRTEMARAMQAINRSKCQQNMTQFFAPVNKIKELVATVSG